MTKYLSMKYLACIAVFGALIAITPAPAKAAAGGLTLAAATVEHSEISARRYYRYRPYRYHRPYRYYYRPRYYSRPYYRPYRYYRYY